MTSQTSTFPKVQIHPVFFIVAAAIGWMNTTSLLGIAIWVGVIFVSILVHEFGHALTAIAFGQRARIDLVALGGLTTREGEKISGWKNFLIVLNGPMAGFLLAALSFSLLALTKEKESVLGAIFFVSLYVNVFWTLVNLLPIQPLDGGQLLMIVLEGVWGLKGVRMAFLLSMFLAGALSLFLFVHQILIGGAFFLMFAFESYRTWSSLKEASPLDEDEPLQQLLKQGEEHIQRGFFEEAEEELKAVHTKTGRGILHQKASLLLARLYRDQGKLDQAIELLSHEKYTLNTEALLLLHDAYVQKKEWKEALKWGKELYELQPSGEIALLNARASAALNQEGEAIGWLHCAKREGITHFQSLLNEPEFERLRAQGSLQNF